jgi:hypothetical protein
MYVKMKYRLIIFAAFLGIFFSCEREISPEQADRFIKYYGNYLMDEARDVEVLEDGSIAICGIDSLDGEGKRMVLILTDEYGNMKSGFPRYFTEDGLNSGANALVVKRGGQGGFLLCGFVERPSIVPSEIQRDLFLVRISSTGQELWKKSFGSLEDESILHATERISSGFMLAGYQVRNNKTDIMIMGVTEEGDSIKLNLNYNNPFSDNASANYILNTGDQYLCVCTYDKINNQGTDILILNLDDELSPNDEILTGDFDEFAECIVEAENNQYLVLGNRISQGRSEIVVHLIETSGLLITSSNLMTTINERDADLYAERFIKLQNGRYAIIGTCVKDEDSNMFLQFLSSDYQEDEIVFFGSAGDQFGADIELYGDGGLLLLGTNRVDQNSMISLIKTNESGEL